MYCVDNSSIISYQILYIMHYRLTVYSVLQGAILYVSKRRHVVLQYFSAMLCIPWEIVWFLYFFSSFLSQFDFLSILDSILIALSFSFFLFFSFLPPFPLLLFFSSSSSLLFLLPPLSLPTTIQSNPIQS